MNKFKINKELSLNDIKYLNDASRTNDIMIIFENTKLINPEYIKLLSDRVCISVLGGLNPTKNKYDNEYYQERTYYTKIEICKIIEIFRSIEKQINPMWNETEKCMFVYKTLCESLNTEHNSNNECVNGIDVTRNLLGLIYHKSVCAGFSMIFKEAMDRIGIECIYQNKRHTHAWNVVKIDGKYRCLDLTWDCTNKQNGNCNFYFFGRKDKSFYEEKSHDITNENEETQYPVEPFNLDELSETWKTISRKRDIDINLSKIVNRDGDNLYYSIIPNKRDHIDTYVVCFDDNIPYIINVEKGSKIENLITKNNIGYFTKSDTKSYVRDDGSAFLVKPTKNNKCNVQEYIYLEVKEDGENKCIRKTYVLSESDLIDIEEDNIDFVANELLSSKRKEEKINNFHGYVGYIDRNKNIVFDRSFEEEELNVKR